MRTFLKPQRLGCLTRIGDRKRLFINAHLLLIMKARRKLAKATVGRKMKTYIFRTAMEQEDDGRWSAWIHALPGCTAWGHTKQEALGAIQDAAEVYLADMLEAGEELPKEGVEVVEEPIVAVTV